MVKVSDVTIDPTAVDVPSNTGVSNVSGVLAASDVSGVLGIAAVAGVLIVINITSGSFCALCCRG